MKNHYIGQEFVMQREIIADEKPPYLYVMSPCGYNWWVNS
jgi:hypothetical protein